MFLHLEPVACTLAPSYLHVLLHAHMRANVKSISKHVHQARASASGGMVCLLRFRHM